jgi:protein SCO1/2
MKTLQAVILSIALLAVLAILAGCQGSDVTPIASASSDVVFLGEEMIPPKQISNFDLIDRTGERLRLRDLKGKFVLVGFGYTRCPDVCPALYNTFKQIRNSMTPAMYDDVDLVIITVDPDLDFPDGLKQ